MKGPAHLQLINIMGKGAPKFFYVYIFTYVKNTVITFVHNLINCLKGRHLSRLKASSLNIFTNLGVWSGNKMILLDLWGRRSSISTRAGQGQVALWVMSASDCYKKDECIKWKSSAVRRLTML